ncbi:hypothetical protein FGF1_26520 [Flavobacteriaceae bacterium GF1]
MKSIYSIFLGVFLSLAFYSCEEEGTPNNNINYVAFSSQDFSATVPIGGSASVDVTILTANTTNADRAFTIVIDDSAAAAGSYSFPNTITVPAGSQEGTVTATLSDVDLGVGVNTLSLSFADEEGLFSGESSTISYVQECSEVMATLDFAFDGFGSEITWSVLDVLGSVVESGGPYADGQANASESFMLCAGRDYTLEVNDSFGDGLSYPNNGSFTLAVEGVTKVTGGGNFGSQVSTDFDTN